MHNCTVTALEVRSLQIQAGLGQSLEPGTAGQEKEEKFPGLLIQTNSQTLLSILQTSLRVLVLAQGLGTYPSLCLNPLCHPAFSWRVSSSTQASVQMPLLCSGLP